MQTRPDLPKDKDMNIHHHLQLSISLRLTRFPLTIAPKALSMASVKYFCFVSALLLPLFILLGSHRVTCKDSDEDTLLQGLNSYRTSFNLSPFTKNDKAGCLANEIADQLENKPCVPTTAATAILGTSPQISSDYQKQLSKCKIDVTTTRDGVILPVCVPKRVPTLVLTNYTRTGYSTYLNNSKFTSAGVGKEEDWVVVVLSTSSPGGSFVSGSTMRSGFGVVWKCIAMLMMIVNSL